MRFFSFAAGAIFKEIKKDDRLCTVWEYLRNSSDVRNGKRITVGG